MKRLIDEPELSPADQRLAELVRQAEPLKLRPASKRATLSRLDRRRAWSFRLRTPAFGVALLVAGAATAAVGYRWAETSAPAPSPPPQPAPAAVRASAAPLSQHRAAEAPAQDVAVPAPVTESQERAPPRRTQAVAAKPRAAGEDPAPVLDAIRALRKSRDPARAQQLLDSYLASNPRGALSEDALGLAIEAAAARRDPRAADYARRYLSLFPNGRFRALAQQALRRR